MPTFHSAIDRIAATSAMRQDAREELREIDYAAFALLRSIDEWSTYFVFDEGSREWVDNIEPALARLRRALKEEL